MVVIAVVSPAASQLASLRSALDELNLRHELVLLDTDLGALCHFRKAEQAPDLVLVNGTLPVCETPQFVRDLREIAILSGTPTAILEPLPEDAAELNECGELTLLANPLRPADLQALLTLGWTRGASRVPAS